LGPESFVDRLAVVLVFFGDVGPGGDQARLWSLEAVLPEFGRRRVQLLGVVPATARELREATQESAMTLLADVDRSIHVAFAVDDGDQVAVVVDRHGTVAAVLTDEDARPEAILAALDRLLEQDPDAFQPHPDVPAEPGAAAHSEPGSQG